MKKSIEDLQVGDELFCVRTYNYPSTTVKIKKIGKAYIYFENGKRAYKDSLLSYEKGYGRGQYATYYLSESDYLEEKTLNNGWGEFRRLVSEKYKVPELVTIERINQCLEILGLSKKEEKK